MDDALDGSDCDKNKARILSAFFAFKDLTEAGHLTFGAKKAFIFL